MRKYRYGEAEHEDQVGVVTGLAWTEVGGDMLTIEAVKVPGKGRMTITGKLGDVMKESIQAAQVLRPLARRVRDQAGDLRADRHPHPRAGGRDAQGRPVGRRRHGDVDRLGADRHPGQGDVAMTGEVTLRGRVLPIGGLKEKLLAALRGGVKTVLIPKENEKDLAEIPENVTRPGDHPGQHMDEVLRIAFGAHARCSDRGRGRGGGAGGQPACDGDAGSRAPQLSRPVATSA